jgi:hypothetical protein
MPFGTQRNWISSTAFLKESLISRNSVHYIQVVEVSTNILNKVNQVEFILVYLDSSSYSASFKRNKTLSFWKFVLKCKES